MAERGSFHIERNSRVRRFQAVNMFKKYRQESEDRARGQSFCVFHKAALRAVESTVYNAVAVNDEKCFHSIISPAAFYHISPPFCQEILDRSGLKMAVDL
jgi:hypothetical protein